MPAWEQYIGLPLLMLHDKIYKRTNGRIGHRILPGTPPNLLLTTTGRKSGEKYIFPLFYGEDNGKYLIVASKGGAPDHPGWYKNIESNPNVELQVKGDVFRARARPALGEERERLWAQMVELYPSYESYRRKTTRQIPVVVLERV